MDPMPWYVVEMHWRGNDLFDPPIVFGCMHPMDADLGSLLPAESRHVRNAVIQRQREFAAGRQLARRLMGRFGIDAQVPLLPGPDRAPRWPQGIVGTVTHTRQIVAVAVARSEDILSLGCDMEPDEELPRAIVPLVLTAAEQALLDDRRWSAGVMARLAFSAKEATYKAQYPLTRCFLDFHDLHLEIDVGGRSFVATLQRDADRFTTGTRFRGIFRLQTGLIATAVVLHHGTT